MYGETEGRFLVTVKAENKERFEKLFDGKYSEVVAVKGKDLKMKEDGRSDTFSLSVPDMLKVYHRRAA